MAPSLHPQRSLPFNVERGREKEGVRERKRAKAREERTNDHAEMTNERKANGPRLPSPF